MQIVSFPGNLTWESNSGRGILLVQILAYSIYKNILTQSHSFQLRTSERSCSTVVFLCKHNSLVLSGLKIAHQFITFFKFWIAFIVIKIPRFLFISYGFNI